MSKAVAVDLGATSGRIALGELKDGQISFEIHEQITHDAQMVNGQLRWDIKLLTSLCERALHLAQSKNASSLGIDSWGVDHGFLESDGNPMGAPICYRDLSHLKAFEELKPHRRRLYELTGTQHQPFNTICQLVARKNEDPSFVKRVAEWLILPDFLGYLLGAGAASELTQASTTQLLGIDGEWSEEAFQIAGWPLPTRAITLPGHKVGSLIGGIDLVSVGSHDTASAVVGFGTLGDSELFLNVGTWSLAGSVIPSAITSVEAETQGFTNERTVDGRIRFLKNIPGFYFINRLHKDLGIAVSVPEWLQSATPAQETIDLLRPEFFNPDSMLETCSRSLSHTPSSTAAWAGIALKSLADAVAETSVQIAKLTGQKFKTVRVGGGGSQSQEFCQTLANGMGVEVLAGPAEATVLGNLAAQFVAQGALKDWDEAYRVVEASSQKSPYLPA